MSPSVVVLALSAFAPAQLTDAEGALQAIPPPDVQPVDQTTVPANGYLYVLAYFDDGSETAATLSGADGTTTLELTQSCGERDPYRCLLSAPLSGIAQGDDATLFVTSAVGDVTIEVAVGPEDQTPPPALDLTAGQIYFYPASTDDESSFFFEILAGDLDPDVAVVELARSEENEAGDEELTTIQYRLRADLSLIGGDFSETLQGAEPRTVCYRAITRDLAGHEAQGERLCVDVSEENAIVEPTAFGCACLAPEELSAPLGGLAVFVGLAWRVRRRRR